MTSPLTLSLYVGLLQIQTHIGGGGLVSNRHRHRDREEPEMETHIHTEMFAYIKRLWEDTG